jgi:hypothetical protein
MTDLPWAPALPRPPARYADRRATPMGRTIGVCVLTKPSNCSGSFNPRTARAGNRRFFFFWLVSALRAHTKAPHKTDALWETLRPLKRPGRARTENAVVLLQDGLGPEDVLVQDPARPQRGLRDELLRLAGPDRGRWSHSDAA